MISTHILIDVVTKARRGINCFAVSFVYYLNECKLLVADAGHIRQRGTFAGDTSGET